MNIEAYKVQPMFPCECGHGTMGSLLVNRKAVSHGMSVYEHFVASALNGVLANQRLIEQFGTDPNMIAQRAIKCAEAALGLLQAETGLRIEAAHHSPPEPAKVGSNPPSSRDQT